MRTWPSACWTGWRESSGEKHPEHPYTGRVQPAKKWPEGCNAERCGDGVNGYEGHKARGRLSPKRGPVPRPSFRPHILLGPPRRRFRWESYLAFTAGAGPSVPGVVRHTRLVSREHPTRSLRAGAEGRRLPEGFRGIGVGEARTGTKVSTETGR